MVIYFIIFQLCVEVLIIRILMDLLLISLFFSSEFSYGFFMSCRPIDHSKILFQIGPSNNKIWQEGHHFGHLDRRSLEVDGREVDLSTKIQVKRVLVKLIGCSGCLFEILHVFFF